MTGINPSLSNPIFDIVETGDGEFVHQIPEACHPGYIRGDGEVNERAKSALAYVAKELTNLNVGRVKLDPSHEHEVQRGFDAIGAAITDARTTLKAQAKRLSDILVEKSSFKADPALTSMVVGTFQGLSVGQRVEAIAKLIDQNDGSTLAILNGISNVYTGIPDDVRATIEPRVFAKNDSHVFGQLEDVRFNLARIEAASVASANAYARFAAPMHRAASTRHEVHKSVVG